VVSALVASPARCTRLPSQVPSPAPTTAPTGPAANAPMTPPVTNPIGSCGVAGLGSPAKAPPLIPNKPMVPTALENAVFITAPQRCFAKRRRPPPHGSYYGPTFGRFPARLGANNGD